MLPACRTNFAEVARTTQKVERASFRGLNILFSCNWDMEQTERSSGGNTTTLFGRPCVKAARAHTHTRARAHTHTHVASYVNFQFSL